MTLVIAMCEIWPADELDGLEEKAAKQALQKLY